MDINELPGKEHIRTILTTLSPVLDKIKDRHKRTVAKNVAQTMYELLYYDANPELKTQKLSELTMRTRSLLQNEPVAMRPAFATAHGATTTHGHDALPSSFSRIEHFDDEMRMLDTLFDAILESEPAALAAYKARAVQQTILHEQDKLVAIKKGTHAWGVATNGGRARLRLRITPQHPLIHKRNSTTQPPRSRFRGFRLFKKH